MQEELNRTQAVQVSFSLAKHDFIAKLFGGIFLSFQRGSKDFLDIHLYLYTIWFEFSRKKSRTDRTSLSCQAPSNLESFKKMDSSKMSYKKNWGQNGHIQLNRENECSGSLRYQTVCKINDPKSSWLKSTTTYLADSSVGQWFGSGTWIAFLVLAGLSCPGVWLQ